LEENLLGVTPEFNDKSIVYSVEEKFGIISITTGFVYIDLEIILKDFNLHGIE